MRTNLGSMKKEAHARCDTVLMEVHALIDWEGLRTGLMEVYRREINQGEGQRLLDPLVMFKAVLLGQWHHLSNPKLEEALHMRTDFMDFCGTGFSDDAPDEATLCRFRNRLITSGRLAGMLAGVNAELQAHGLMVKNSHSATTGSVRVRSPARPKLDMISSPDAEGTSETSEASEVGNKPGGMATKYPKLASFTKTRRPEPDATWVRKNKKKYFGYVSYVSVANDASYIPRSAHGGQQK